MFYSIINFTDLFILIIIIISSVSAAWRGAIRETSTTLVWLLPIIAANFLYIKIIPIIENHIQIESLVPLVAWMIPFILILIFLLLLNKFIFLPFLKNFSGIFDHIVGFFLGALRALILISLVYLTTIFILEDESLFPTNINQSNSLPIIRKLSINLIPLIPNDFSEILIEKF